MHRCVFVLAVGGLRSRSAFFPDLRCRLECYSLTLYNLCMMLYPRVRAGLSSIASQSYLPWRNVDIPPLFARIQVIRRSVHDSSQRLPQTTDLFQTYHGLIALGKIQYDEEQIRVIMQVRPLYILFPKSHSLIAQLRRLQKELDGYAPPALTSQYHNPQRSAQGVAGVEPESAWWQSDESTATPDVDSRALIRAPSHAEDLANLTTPKVSCSHYLPRRRSHIARC